MKKPLIFTIGSATFDLFVKPENQALVSMMKPDIREKWLALPYGAKVKIDDVIETFGGGATNTAVAFARMGFEAHFVGKIGAHFGDPVVENLQKEGVGIDFVKKTKRDKTGFSTIINTLDGDRTVLAYAGANCLFKSKDLPLEAMAAADWIFLNHISGDADKTLHSLVRFLDAHPAIRIAWNPGSEQLKTGVKKWSKLLRHVDVLFVNKEEASLFTKTPYLLAGIRQESRSCHVHKHPSFLPAYADDVSDIMKVFFKTGVKQVVITDGRNGAQASDGKRLYFCPVLSTKRVDSLGAGDSFASGFTGALISGKGLKDALIYGTLNANSVVSCYGAQQGLLPLKSLEKRFKKSSLCVSSARLI